MASGIVMRFSTVADCVSAMRIYNFRCFVAGLPPPQSARARACTPGRRAGSSHPGWEGGWPRGRSMPDTRAMPDARVRCALSKIKDDRERRPPEQGALLIFCGVYNRAPAGPRAGSKNKTGQIMPTVFRWGWGCAFAEGIWWGVM
jgi:hypothetical protein